MLKREKEVFGYLLDTEEAVMKELEKQYRQALDDINTSIRLMQADEWSQSRAYHIQYQKTLKKQVEAILEKLHSDEYTTMQRYLSGTYTDAYVGTVYALHGQSVPVIMPIDQKAALKAVMTDSKINTDLYTHLGVDITRLKKTIRNEITRGIASGMLFQDIARNVAFNANISLNRAKNIAQTEGHRIQQASADDARNHAKAKGADVVKQWDSTLDGATRDTHRKLDGQIREVGEPFEMDGKEAQYPGGFGDPSEDCRCRCVALTRARSALDAAELATMKERAKFFGLDKTKDFEDFEKKYLKAAKMLETPSETGQLAVPYSKRGIQIEKRLQGYLEKLHADGDYITRPSGEIKYQDLAILTTETGAEFTLLTIGKQSVLIHGAEKHTTINQELIDMLVKNKGRFDCHSHPYVGDLVPSEADLDFLKLLPWQEESVIIEPGQTAMRYSKMGTVGSMRLEERRDESLYTFLFGEGD